MLQQFNSEDGGQLESGQCRDSLDGIFTHSSQQNLNLKYRNYQKRAKIRNRSVDIYISCPLQSSISSMAAKQGVTNIDTRQELAELVGLLHSLQLKRNNKASKSSPDKSLTFLGPTCMQIVFPGASQG